MESLIIIEAYEIFFYFSSSCSMWNLVSWAGIKPGPPAMRVGSLSHWTPRKVPPKLILNNYSLTVFLKWRNEFSTFKIFFSFPSLAIPQFGLLSQVSSLRSSSGHSGPVLPLSMQHALPCSAPTQCWQTRASGLLLCWELWLGMQSVCVCIFLLVMLPSEIPKPPTDPPVRGFPGVWELLLLHNSLSGMGLNP